VKTISLKKVSAVAVASLGFGLLSVVPANAAGITAWTKYESNVTAVSLATATATPVINSAVYVNVGATTLTTGTVAGATTTGAITQLRGVLSSYPAGGFVPVSSSVNVAGAAAGTPTVPAGTDVVITNTNNTGASGVNSIFVRDIDDAAGVAAYAVAATATTGLASMSFTPTKAGTYVLTVWNDGPAIGALTIGNNTVDSNEAVQTISITVAAAPALSLSLSTMFQTLTTAAPADSNTDKVPARVSRALGTAAVAAVTVTLKNSAGGGIVTSDAITLGATVSGDAGGVGATIETAANTTFAGKCPGTQPGRVATPAVYNGVAQIYFCATNQSGSSTITVTATDADGKITTIGSETINYYGAVATLEVKPVLSVIRTAGGTTGVNTATRIATTAPASMVVTAKDSAGQLVGGINAGLVALATTGIASVACTEDIYDTGTSGAFGLGGTGYYGCTVTSTGAAASGGKDSVTIRIVDPADATKFISATAAPVTFGGSPSTVVMGFNKAAYTPGEKGVLTVTVTDSSGNPASDGVYTTLFSGASTSNATGSLPAASVTVIGGKNTSDIFVPNGKGTVTVSNTLGATIASKAGAAVSATAEVTDPNAGLLTQIDALNAKIVALNALIAKIMKKLGVK